MSEEQLKAFLAKVESDEGLQKKLQAEGADPVAIAKEAGFTITMAELIRLQAQTISELSDEELENAAGGKGSPPNTIDTKELNLAISLMVIK